MRPIAIPTVICLSLLGGVRGAIILRSRKSGPSEGLAVGFGRTLLDRCGLIMFMIATASTLPSAIWERDLLRGRVSFSKRTCGKEMAYRIGADVVKA